MIRRMIVLFAALWVCSFHEAAAATLLDGVPDQAQVHVQPGTQIQLFAHLQNRSDVVVYLRGLSDAASATFTGSVSLAGMLATMPDSLRPGDSWAGPVAMIGVPAGPGSSTTHTLDVFVTGGVNPFAQEVVAQWTFVLDDSSATTAVPPTQAHALALSAAPNPSANVTRFALALPKATPVELRVYDITGRARRVIASGAYAAGHYTFDWDGRDDAGQVLHAGTYFVRLTTAMGARHLTLVRIP